MLNILKPVVAAFTAGIKSPGDGLDLSLISGTNYFTEHSVFILVNNTGPGMFYKYLPSARNKKQNGFLMR